MYVICSSGLGGIKGVQVRTGLAEFLVCRDPDATIAWSRQRTGQVTMHRYACGKPFQQASEAKAIHYLKKQHLAVKSLKGCLPVRFAFLWSGI